MSDKRIQRTADKLGTGYHQTEILLHALGFQKRGFKWTMGGWRNHFDAGESDNAGVCAGLAASGWMDQLVGGYYIVTDAGKAALRLAGWKFEDEGVPR